MKTQIPVHKFNGDLLLEDSDRKLAALKYPTILHVLDFPELRDVFLCYDQAASRTKRVGRRAGIVALSLGFAALATVSFEYPLAHYDPQSCLGFACEHLRKTLAAVAALCGIVGVLIGGGGVLFARRKREWLLNRFMGERIRQFQFQTFVFRQPEILSSLTDENAKQAFLAKRKLWFAEFSKRYEDELDSKYTDFIDEHGDDSTKSAEVEHEFSNSSRRHRLSAA